MKRYEALSHAVRAHAGQKDKCDLDYILHPLAVAEAIQRATNPWSEWHDDGQVVALLHDVWEDTDYKLDRDWFTQTQWDALSLVTKQPQEIYAEYIERVCSNPLAIVVKLADLWHNLSPARQDCLPKAEALGLHMRYMKARDRLWEALGHEWWPQ